MYFLLILIFLVLIIAAAKASTTDERPRIRKTVINIPPIHKPEVSYERNDRGMATAVIYRWWNNGGRIHFRNLTSLVPWDSLVGGTIVIESFEMSGTYSEPPILSDDGKYYVLGMVHEPAEAKQPRRFNIAVYDREEHAMHRSRRTLKWIFIRRMSGSLIELNEACHDQSNPMDVIFNDENFEKIK